MASYYGVRMFSIYLMFICLVPLVLLMPIGNVDEIPIEFFEDDGPCGALKPYFKPYFAHYCAGQQVNITVKPSPKWAISVDHNRKVIKRFHMEISTIHLNLTDTNDHDYVEHSKKLNTEMQKGAFYEEIRSFWNLQFFDVIGFETKCAETGDWTMSPTASSHTTVTNKSRTTTVLTSSSSTTTTENPLILADCTMYWVSVRVAEVTEILIKDQPAIPQDFAVHVGFEKIFGNLNADQVQGKIKDFIKKSIEFAEKYGLSKEVKKWFDENQWIVNIQPGRFQYVPVAADKFALIKNKKRVMMLLHECVFGEFLMIPLELREDLTASSDKEFDWSKDFQHLERCELVLNDLLDKFNPDKPTSTISAVPKTIKSLDFNIGLELNDQSLIPIPMNQASCEAFKYKYGYTDPLRKSELDESAYDYARVKNFGRFLLPPEEACGPMRQYTLWATMSSVSMTDMINMGYAEDVDARITPDAICTMEGPCIKCFVKDCYPTIYYKIEQTVYNCSGFKYWMTRVGSSMMFTVDYHDNTKKQEISKDFTSYYYLFDGHDMRRKMRVPGWGASGWQQYNLYEEKHWKNNDN